MKSLILVCVFLSPQLVLAKNALPCEKQINSLLEAAGFNTLNKGPYEIKNGKNRYSYNGFTESSVNLREFNNKVDKIADLYLQKDAEIAKLTDKAQYEKLGQDLVTLTEVLNACKNKKPICSNSSVAMFKKIQYEKDKAFKKLMEKNAPVNQAISKIDEQIAKAKISMQTDISIYDKTYLRYETRRQTYSKKFGTTPLFEKAQELDSFLKKMESLGLSQTEEYTGYKNQYKKLRVEIEARQKGSEDASLPRLGSPVPRIVFHPEKIVVSYIQDGAPAQEHSSPVALDPVSCKYSSFYTSREDFCDSKKFEKGPFCGEKPSRSADTTGSISK